MGQITVEKNVGGIEGLCVITPAVHGDNRGYFMETYNQNDMGRSRPASEFCTGQPVQLHKRRSARPALPRNSSLRENLSASSKAPSLMWLWI